MVRNPGGKRMHRGAARIASGSVYILVDLRVAHVRRMPLDTRPRTRHPMKRLLPTAASLALVLAAFAVTAQDAAAPATEPAPAATDATTAAAVAEAPAADAAPAESTPVAEAPAEASEAPDAEPAADEPAAQ